MTSDFIFDLENLLGIGHLRQTELFGHLRTYLGRIAVDGLAACDDHVGAESCAAHTKRAYEVASVSEPRILRSVSR